MSRPSRVRAAWRLGARQGRHQFDAAPPEFYDFLERKKRDGSGPLFAPAERFVLTQIVRAWWPRWLETQQTWVVVSNSRLAEATGYSKPHVGRVLGDLVKLGVLAQTQAIGKPRKVDLDPLIRNVQRAASEAVNVRNPPT